MNNFRVAHVTYSLAIGGLERMVVNLVRGSLYSTYRCCVVCLEQEGAFAKEIRALGVPLFNMSKKEGWDWDCIFRLARLFRQEGVHIVHTHNIPAHFHGGLAALLAQVPVRVHTKHGRDYPHIRKRVLLNRILSSFTDVIVTVSDDARDVALQIERVNPRKVTRIWNGIDTELYRPRARSQQSEVRTPTIGTVARLSPEKDQKTMLEAFKLVLQRWNKLPTGPASESSVTSAVKLLPPPRLLLVGDGPCMTELKDSAAKLGIAESVDFWGTRTDIPNVLQSFDIFTLSSITEGISMTLLEAMASGLPCVATDVGGNREIINPPECGLIVPPRDPQALAAAYLELLQAPERRVTMGLAGRARVEQHFSLQNMVQQYERIYDKLLAAKVG